MINLKPDSDKNLRKAVYEVFEKRCCYCGISLEYNQNFYVEHVIPKQLNEKSLDRKKEVLNFWNLPDDFNLFGYENLVSSCRKCNLKKGKDEFNHLIKKGLSTLTKERINDVIRKQKYYAEIEKVKKLRDKVELSPNEIFHAISGKIEGFEIIENISDEIIIKSTKSVYFHSYLPKFPRFFGSALITFNSPLIQDCSITFSHNQLISEIFYNFGSPVNNLYRKFIVGVDEKKNNVLVQLGNNRFFLSMKEATELCELIDFVAPKYLENLISIENEIYNAQKFERTKRGNYKLIKISRFWWDLILKFTNEYDYENGETNWHIFDRKSTYIQVYCKVKNDSRKNFRVVIYPETAEENLDGYRTPNNEVWLCWSPDSLRYEGNISSAFSYDDIEEVKLKAKSDVVWDTTKTFNWLKDELLPEVYNWALKKHSKERNNFIDKLFLKSKNRFTIPYPRTETDFTFETIIYVEKLSGIQEYFDAITTLQSFYHVARNYYIPPHIVKGLLNAYEFCLANADLENHEKNYIEGNINAITRYTDDYFYLSGKVQYILSSLIYILEKEKVSVSPIKIIKILSPTIIELCKIYKIHSYIEKIIQPVEDEI